MSKLDFLRVRDMAKVAQKEWDARLAEIGQDFRDLVAHHARAMRRLGYGYQDVKWMVRTYKGAMKFGMKERNGT